MPAGEPGRAATIAGTLTLVAALVAGIASIELLVDHSYRAAALRLVAAAVLLVAVSRIRAFVRAAVEWPSAWEERAGETGWAPPTHGQFEHFQKKVEEALGKSGARRVFQMIRRQSPWLLRATDDDIAF